MWFFLNVHIFRPFGTPFVFVLSRKPLGNKTYIEEQEKKTSVRENMCTLLEIFLSIHKIKQLLKGKPFQSDALQLASTTLSTLRKE